MPLPLLTYHAVEMTSRRPGVFHPEQRVYLIRPDFFEAQLRYLALHPFRSLHVQDLVSIAESRSPLPACSVCTTFDDGYSSDYWVVFPLFRKYHLTATFFVVTDHVGKPGYVTWVQLTEMAFHGMSIQSHSHTHPFLSQCTLSEVKQELVRSKLMIKDHLGSSVSAFAAPRGDWKDRFRSLAKE